MLRAARLVIDHLPHARFLIAGPITEEPEYYQECLDLTKQLHIEPNVEFMGMRNRASVFLHWVWSYATWQRGARIIQP